MSYAICRMQKMKRHDVKGIQFHNQRERQSQTNFDIDPERTPLNYDLLHKENINYNERVNEIIESQKTGTRKTRKDAVVVNELLITSDHDFFACLELKEQERFFQESYTLFSQRYGEQNIAYAMVHQDEHTPHMHLGIVPMKDGKLQGKNVFNRQELQWIQDEFPKYMKQRGFDVERGEKGSDREHLTSQRFKEQQLQEQLRSIEIATEERQYERKQLEETIQDCKSRLGDLEASLDFHKKVDDVETKKEKKMGLFESDRVLVKQEDFDHIKTLAKTSEAFKKESEKYKWELRREQKKNEELKETNRALRCENVELKKENQGLKKENHLLFQTLECLKQVYQEKVPEIKRMIGFVKAELMDKAKDKWLTKNLFKDKEEVQGAEEFLKNKEEKRKKRPKKVRRRRQDQEIER